jgi:hypothetical protein
VAAALRPLSAGPLGDAKSSLGDAKSSLGDAKSSLGDAVSSLGDATSCAAPAARARADAAAAVLQLAAHAVNLPALWHAGGARVLVAQLQHGGTAGAVRGVCEALWWLAANMGFEHAAGDGQRR